MEKELSASEPSTQRIEAFSDGVLAIVVTLMVLEIKMPQLPATVTDEVAWLAFAPLFPKLMAYALSFVMITIFWINHYQLFHSIRVSTRGLLWLNNLWLFWICLLPFPTSFLGEHPNMKLALLFFGIELFFCAVSFSAIRYYGHQHRLFHTYVDAVVTKKLMQRSLWGPALYLLAIVSCFLSIYITYILFVAVPVLFIVSSVNTVRK